MQVFLVLFYCNANAIIMNNNTIHIAIRITANGNNNVHSTMIKAAITRMLKSPFANNE